MTLGCTGSRLIVRAEGPGAPSLRCRRFARRGLGPALPSLQRRVVVRPWSRLEGGPSVVGACRLWRGLRKCWEPVLPWERWPQGSTRPCWAPGVRASRGDCPPTDTPRRAATWGERRGAIGSSGADSAVPPCFLPVEVYWERARGADGAGCVTPGKEARAPVSAVSQQPLISVLGSLTEYNKRLGAHGVFIRSRPIRIFYLV